MGQAMSTILLCLYISFISTVRKLQFNPFNELYTVLSGGIPEYRAPEANQLLDIYSYAAIPVISCPVINR
jgi:hypothetical protein